MLCLSSSQRSGISQVSKVLDGYIYFIHLIHYVTLYYIISHLIIFLWTTFCGDNISACYVSLFCHLLLVSISHCLSHSVLCDVSVRDCVCVLNDSSKTRGRYRRGAMMSLLLLSSFSYPFVSFYPDTVYAA